MGISRTTGFAVVIFASLLVAPAPASAKDSPRPLPTIEFRSVVYRDDVLAYEPIVVESGEGPGVVGLQAFEGWLAARRARINALYPGYRQRTGGDALTVSVDSPDVRTLSEPREGSIKLPKRKADPARFELRLERSDWERLRDWPGTEVALKAEFTRRLEAMLDAAEARKARRDSGDRASPREPSPAFPAGGRIPTYVYENPKLPGGELPDARAPELGPVNPVGDARILSPN
jgi:hypothetical protein